MHVARGDDHLQQAQRVHLLLAAIVVTIVTVGVVGYLLWSWTAPSAPRIRPGQSVQNPMGEQSPTTSRDLGGLRGGPGNPKGPMLR